MVVSEQITSTEAILDFYLNFGYLIVLLRSKIQIYKMGNWSSPNIVETREPTVCIAQCLTMFFLVSSSGGQIVGYDGRVISRITDPSIKWDLLSKENLCCSPSNILIVSPDNRKNIFSFSASTGQRITPEPYTHASEIRNIQTNQSGNQAKARFGFVNSTGDLLICRFISPNPRLPPTLDVQKLGNFIDQFVYHATQDLILSRTGDKLTVWCAPSAAFTTPELLSLLKMEVNILFDATEIERFDSTHAFVRSKDGSLCVSQISPFLFMIYEAVEVYKNWNMVLRICRSSNQKELWATCASLAIQAGEVESAQEAYSALSMIDRVVFLAKVKKMKSPASRNAMMAVLQGRIDDAEEILIQGGCT